MIVTTYTFDASAKTITFGGFTSIDLNRIQIITNATDNVMIFNFADDTLKGTVATNVLTLQYDTTTMDDADKLKIIYEEDDEDGKKVTEQFAPKYEDNVAEVAKVEHRYTISNIAIAATISIIRSAAGLLHTVNIGQASHPTLTIFDNASGASGTVLHHNDAGQVGSWLVDGSTSNGITCYVTGGLTPKSTLSWR